jgi:hypothetical protein
LDAHAAAVTIRLAALERGAAAAGGDSAGFGERVVRS